MNRVYKGIGEITDSKQLLIFENNNVEFLAQEFLPEEMKLVAMLCQLQRRYTFSCVKLFSQAFIAALMKTSVQLSMMQ